ncbi:MAG: 3-oxoacyl-ACP reductase FabG [Spirochaetaceae bacterium]|nr:3-oxoacyl-ACP reductase FabG [Spirochaetaceae bacterium]MBR4824932.1 3-oxoacyl-ACP reductase FabG [Spirochaetaceae bacterium]
MEQTTAADDKKVLVTGASGGIGKAVALAVAAAGYYVICHYNRNKNKAEDVLAAIKQNGGDGELIQFDISDREDCRTKLSALTEKYGALWGIINNAGITKDNTFVALSGDDWDSVVHTNLDSFYNVLQPLVLPIASRRNKRGGRIITIASVSGVMGNRGQTNYSASKAGIIGATKALAVELASRAITVNCIAPGVIETDMINGAPLDIILESIPMKRVGKPEEVAALAVFLLSEQAGYITRQVISVNGGIV